MTTSFQRLFELWSASIPLVSAMQIEFAQTDQRWHLEAPLEPNRNHMGTGFGGSIASLATLAGWAQTWMLLPAPDDVHIVIAKSSVRYHEPATAALVATAQAPAREDVENFLARLRTHGRAGINIVAEVHSNGVAAATLTGKYVAALKRQS